ncbi:MAG: anti-sigma factor RsbA family regulatory protein [Actinomycetes bacterium]
MTLPGNRMEHQAAFYRGHDELLDVVVPFMEEGLTTGEATVAVATEDTVAMLKSALGGARALAVLDAEEVFTRPIDALAAYRSVTEAELDAGAGRVRLLAEVVPHAMSGWERWAWLEAASNRVLAGLPLSALCLYDEQALPEAVLEVGRRTHPRVYTGTSVADNDDFVPPERLLGAVVRRELGAVPARAPDLYVSDVPDVRTARWTLEHFLMGLPGSRAEDVVGAVSELLTNALGHGRPPVTLDVWLEGPTLVSVVGDAGPGISDPMAGYAPPGGPLAGSGLWLARHLVDHLTFGRQDGRFTVLVETRKPG